MTRAADSGGAAPLSDEARQADSFAKYHDEHARFGGAGREFHERASSFLRSQAHEVARLRARERELVEKARQASPDNPIPGYDCHCELCLELRSRP